MSSSGTPVERARHDVGRLRVEDAGLSWSPRPHEHGVVVDAHADVAEHVLDQPGRGEDATGHGDAVPVLVPHGGDGTNLVGR